LNRFIAYLEKDDLLVQQVDFGVLRVSAKPIL